MHLHIFVAIELNVLIKLNTGVPSGEGAHRPPLSEKIRGGGGSGAPPNIESF